MHATCKVTEGLATWERFAEEFNNTEGREVSLARDVFNGPLWYAWGRALHDLLASDTVPNSINAGHASRRFFEVLRANGFDDEGEIL